MSRTIASAIEEAAKLSPTRGFRFVPETGVPKTPGAPDSSEAFFSFSAIERATARYAGALQALGLEKGDRVALILPANEDFVLCFLGAVRVGIVPVPIYPPMGVGQLGRYLDNAQHVVQKSGAQVLVTSSAIKRLLGTVQAACPELRQVVAIESIRESREPMKGVAISPDDLCFLQFTSGSTSRPKGVMVSHASLSANIDHVMTRGLGADGEVDTGVSWLPLYHDMGLIGFVLAPLVHRVPVVILPPLLYLKQPLSWLQAITRHRGTISYAPNFGYALATKRIREKDLEGIDLSSWRVAGCGAEPIRPETLESFCDAFGRVGFSRDALLPAYGMAEASLAVSFAPRGRGMGPLAVHGPTLWESGEAVVVAPGEAGPREDETVRLVSCGAPFPDHEVGVFALDDATSESALPEGRVGELRVRGPSVMAGYFQDPERTADAFAGGWLRTGDLGFVHAGELYICGRSKEVVIVNGRNYYPQDMEWEASRVEGVRKGNVIAFGARDPSGQETDRERVVVAFELETGVDPARAQPIATAVRRAIQEGLGLTIDDVVPLAPGVLPKTSSGKLQRQKTRALYETAELAARASSRDVDRLETVKQTAHSQLSYLKLAVLGGRARRS